MRRALSLVAAALVACGDSTKEPVTPIVVAETTPVPAPQPSASASPPSSSTAPVEESHAPAPTPSAEEPETGNMWGDSIGESSGRDAGAYRISQSRTSPTLRQGTVAVTGKLPPEVIQRIVRQNFGRYRLCYENGLLKNPKLGGKVIVKFTITRAGDVAKIADGGSDLADKSVVSCVSKAFANLSFPQPASGEVNVVYPIVFTPP